MIHWEVIRQLDNEVRTRFPEMSDEKQVAMVWAAYHEITYVALMGPPPGLKESATELGVTSYAGLDPQQMEFISFYDKYKPI
jgi:hypothetical protein